MRGGGRTRETPAEHRALDGLPAHYLTKRRCCILCAAAAVRLCFKPAVEKSHYNDIASSRIAVPFLTHSA